MPFVAIRVAQPFQKHKMENPRCDCATTVLFLESRDSNCETREKVRQGMPQKLNLARSSSTQSSPLTNYKCERLRDVI